MTSLNKLKKIHRTLEELSNAYRNHSNRPPSVVVGYAAKYAIFVHERQARHAPGKQWKFLEQPARELSAELGRMIVQGMQHPEAKLEEVLLAAGMRLEAASKRIVPVDTGALRAGSFTALEENLEDSYTTARVVSETIHAKVVDKRKKQSSMKRGAAKKKKQTSRNRRTKHLRRGRRK